MRVNQAVYEPAGNPPCTATRRAQSHWRHAALPASQGPGLQRLRARCCHCHQWESGPPPVVTAPSGTGHNKVSTPLHTSSYRSARSACQSHASRGPSPLQQVCFQQKLPSAHAGQTPAGQACNQLCCFEQVLKPRTTPAGMQPKWPELCACNSPVPSSRLLLCWTCQSHCQTSCVRQQPWWGIARCGAAWDCA